MPVRRPRLAPGCRRLAVPLLAAALPATVLAPPVAATLAAAAAAVAWFYRDPERTPPEVDAPGDDEPAAVLAPCDGRISVVREEGDRVRVGTFMSPADVHVTRAPVAGTVETVEHVPGGHWPAFSKESDRNERLCVRFRVDTVPSAGDAPTTGGGGADSSPGDDGDGGGGETVETTMIAGALARRITVYADEGATLAAGDRLGHIAFGSRTDVLLPPAFGTDDLSVSRGDRVRAGESVLAGPD